MKRPTRRDLLLVIGELQGVFGRLRAAAMDDRATERAAALQDLAELGHDLCIKARSFDPPITGRWPRAAVMTLEPQPRDRSRAHWSGRR